MFQINFEIFRNNSSQFNLFNFTCPPNWKQSKIAFYTNIFDQTYGSDISNGFFDVHIFKGIARDLLDCIQILHKMLHSG